MLIVGKRNEAGLFSCSSSGDCSGSVSLSPGQRQPSHGDSGGCPCGGRRERGCTDSIPKASMCLLVIFVGDSCSSGCVSRPPASLLVALCRHAATLGDGCRVSAQPAKVPLSASEVPDGSPSLARGCGVGELHETERFHDNCPHPSYDVFTYPGKDSWPKADQGRQALRATFKR